MQNENGAPVEGPVRAQVAGVVEGGFVWMHRLEEYLDCLYLPLLTLILRWFVPVADAPPVAAVYDRRRCDGRRQEGEWSGSAVASLWRDKGVLERSVLAFRRPAVRLSPFSASRLVSSSSILHPPSSFSFLLHRLPPSPPAPAASTRMRRRSCAYVSHAGNSTIGSNFCQAPFWKKIGPAETKWSGSAVASLWRDKGVMGNPECSGAL